MKSIRLFLLGLAAIATVSTAHADGSDSMNFRFGPVGLIIGAITAHLDFAIAPNWTVGPDVAYWHIKFTGTNTDFEIKATSFGARANWFNNGVYTDGFYIGPFLRHAETKLTLSETNGSTSEASQSGLVGGALFGYGWFWDSFNMMLGGGFSTSLGNKTKVRIVDSGGEATERDVATGLAAEFTLGWTF